MTPRRKIWIECPCGAKRLAEFSPEDRDELHDVLRKPCPICGNTGDGRIYHLVPLPSLRLVKK